MKEMNKHAMYYGVFLAGVLLLNFIFSLIPGVVSMALTSGLFVLELYLVYRFTIDARERIGEGCITYKQALLYVVRLYMYAALLVAFCKYVYFAFIDKYYLSETYAVLKDQMSSIDVYMSSLEQMEAIYTNPAIVAASSLWSNLLFGVVAGLVVAGMVKKGDFFKDTNE